MLTTSTAGFSREYWRDLLIIFSSNVLNYYLIPDITINAPCVKANHKVVCLPIKHFFCIQRYLKEIEIRLFVFQTCLQSFVCFLGAQYFRFDY
jgi:hypothetical protein